MVYAQTLKVTLRSVNHTPFSPHKAGWWGRLFVAALFTFYINYVPIHLATATHLNDLLVSVAEAALHHHGHDEADHHSNENQHSPHPASDHTLTLAASAKAPGAPIVAVFFLPAVASVLISEPEPQPPIPVFERSRPPGESPPDPLQPRAPPLA